MAAETGYDTANLQALSLELARLNAAAVKSGLLRPSDVPKPAPREAKKPRGSKSSAALNRRGKARARRLLSLLRRADDDVSPDVIGTDFTEDGVVRLMTHLRTPRSRKSRFLQRIERFLRRPSAYGVRTSAGISVERLQLVSRQLLEIESQGWTYFLARRAARRRSQTQTAKPGSVGGALPSDLSQGPA